jgi:predicted NodU family carbamoyl transferase
VGYWIKSEDPIGAYAVEDITYELGVNGGQSTLAVNIDYRHARAEIVRIQKVVGPEITQKAIHSALNQLSTELVLYVENYQETDFAQIVEDYAQNEPDVVMEVPQVSATVYPNQGEDRVVEIKFTYQINRDNLRTMQNQVKRVFESAQLYINSDELTHEKYSHLYSFLMERFEYKLDTSITPAYSLLRYGVGDAKAFAFAKPHIKGFDYSFSGLKTSFLYTLRDAQKEDPNFVENHLYDLCASLQKTVVDILMDKVHKAMKETGVKHLAVAGGVSANSGLRDAFVDYGRRHKVEVYIPKFSFTTDNAAMVAITGHFKYLDGDFCAVDLAPYARNLI